MDLVALSGGISLGEILEPAGHATSPHHMTAAALSNQDTAAAVSRDVGWIYMVTTTTHRRADRFGTAPPPKGPVTSGKLVTSNKACQIHGWSFSWEKTLAGSWIASTGLLKSRGGHFHGKKAPAPSWIAATGLAKSRGGHFHKKRRLWQAG